MWKRVIKVFNWFVVAAFALVQFILIHLDIGTLIFLGNKRLWNINKWIVKKVLNEVKIKSEKEMFFIRYFIKGDILHLFLIQSKCGKIRTRKNSVFGHFSLSVPSFWCLLYKFHIALVFILITLSKLKPTEK